MTIQDELAVINDGVASALATGDIDRALTFYCDDVLVVLPGRPTMHGRAELERYFREASVTGPRHMRFESDHVLEEGNLVVDVGRYVTYGPSGPSGPVEEQGKYVAVYRWEDGTLRMVVDTTVSDPALDNSDSNFNDH